MNVFTKQITVKDYYRYVTVYVYCEPKHRNKYYT